MITDKARKKQIKVSVFLSSVLCFVPIVTSLNALIGGFSLVSAMLYGYYFIILLGFFRNNIKHMKKKLFVSLAFFFVSYFVTYLFFPKNRTIMWTSAGDLFNNPTYILLLYVIPAFIASFYIYDIHIFIFVFEVFSIISFILLALRFFGFFIFNSAMPEYMTFSYNLLLPTTYIMILCINKFKWYRAAISAIGIAIIFIAGCRGALLGAVVSPLVYVFMFGRVNKKTKTRIVLLLITLMLVIVFFYEPILQMISVNLTKLGLSSRTLEKLLSSTITDDSGRGVIIDELMAEMRLFGHGLWGDRALNFHYAHNLIIEIIFDYGWIFGSIILLLISYYLLTGLAKAGAQTSIILCALLSTGFVKLMFSGSFLNQEPAFYALIGLCMNQCVKARGKDHFNENCRN